MTKRGVITLPTQLRKALGLSADDQVIAETTPEGILLRPAVTLPIELYSDERLREFEEAETELAAVLKKSRTESVRIFLDANILFSAARTDGAVRRLLALSEAAGHELWADAYVFEEARRNLAAKSPNGLVVLDAMLTRIKLGGLQASGTPLPDTFIYPARKGQADPCRRHPPPLRHPGHRRSHPFRPALRDGDKRGIRCVAGDAGRHHTALMISALSSRQGGDQVQD